MLTHFFHSSAAAVAIHFLKSLPQSTRLTIRKIVLHEDRRSVAHPECHALGLIPFCVQNPQLCVERRVNIWRALESGSRPGNINKYVLWFERIANCKEIWRFQQYKDFQCNYLSQGLSRWIVEASTLAVRSMPIDSFSLVCDGDPAPDQGWKLFEAVKENAAGIGFCKTFPQAINDMVNGKSLIRCNFPIDDLYDPEEIFTKNCLRWGCK